MKLDPAKKPKAIDITFLDKGFLEGLKLPGVYALEKGELRLCFKFGSELSDRPTTIVCPEKDGLLIVLKREKKE